MKHKADLRRQSLHEQKAMEHHGFFYHTLVILDTVASVENVWWTPLSMPRSVLSWARNESLSLIVWSCRKHYRES